jgi:ATP-dependent RNA helicase RhlE
MIIATPGRLIDLLEQRALKLDNIGVLVLDEVDRMLDMGFIRHIEQIITLLPKERQSMGLSATITPRIEQILSKMLRAPEVVSVRTKIASEHIQQDIVRVAPGRDKFDVLTEALGQARGEKIIIFGRTKWGVQKLAHSLSREGHLAAPIHGNLSQPQRQRALAASRSRLRHPQCGLCYQLRPAQYT